VEVHTFFEGEARELEQLRQLANLKLLVVLVQEVLVFDIWEETPEAEVVVI